VLSIVGVGVGVGVVGVGVVRRPAAVVRRFAQLR